jgi:hypothetical protein
MSDIMNIKNLEYFKNDLGENKEKIEFWQCLLPFSPETSVFSSAVKKIKN